MLAGEGSDDPVFVGIGTGGRRQHGDAMHTRVSEGCLEEFCKGTLELGLASRLYAPCNCNVDGCRLFHTLEEKGQGCRNVIHVASALIPDVVASKEVKVRSLPCKMALNVPS